MKKSQQVLLLTLLVVAPLIVVGFIDYLTSLSVSLSLFYLIPIAFASLLAGRKGGIICCVVAAGVFVAAELAGGIGVNLALWNGLMRLGVNLIVGVLLPIAIEEIRKNYAD